MAKKSRKLALLVMPLLDVSFIVSYFIYTASGNKPKIAKKTALQQTM